MKYGLTDDELKRLREVFIRNRRIEQVILYGSPYETDVSLFDGLKNEALKDHIRRAGILLYERGIG